MVTRWANGAQRQRSPTFSERVHRSKSGTGGQSCCLKGARHDRGVRIEAPAAAATERGHHGDVVRRMDALKFGITGLSRVEELERFGFPNVAQAGRHRVQARGSLRVVRAGEMPGTPLVGDDDQRHAASLRCTARGIRFTHPPTGRFHRTNPSLIQPPVGLTSNLGCSRVMSAPEIFRVGEDRLLCDQWHASSRTVVLRPSDPESTVEAASVRRVLDELAERGVDRALTAALNGHAGAPFVAAGFDLHESLCVFRNDLTNPVSRPSFRTRRGSGPRDLQGAARVDERAFAGHVPLDAGGLGAVLGATPVRRFRVVDGIGTPTSGYLCAGLAGPYGYVQRLAVDPSRHREGVARALVLDALRWFNRRGVVQVLVNTRVDNVAARRLYRSTGFNPVEAGLSVWVWHRERSR